MYVNENKLQQNPQEPITWHPNIDYTVPSHSFLHKIADCRGSKRPFRSQLNSTVTDKANTPINIRPPWDGMWRVEA